MLTRPAPLGPQDEPESAGFAGVLSSLVTALRNAFTSSRSAEAQPLPEEPRTTLSARAKRMIRSSD